MDVEAKLRELGFQLPQAAPPAANYLPAIWSGKLVFISGQLPISNGELLYRGKIDSELSIEEGQKAAELCALNILAQLKDVCNGDWDLVDQCMEIGGFVQSSENFFKQHEVVNGASNLIATVLGDRGLHSRFAVGVNSLPLNASVEIKATFKLKKHLKPKITK